MDFPISWNYRFFWIFRCIFEALRGVPGISFALRAICKIVWTFRISAPENRELSGIHSTCGYKIMVLLIFTFWNQLFFKLKLNLFLTILGIVVFIYVSFRKFCRSVSLKVFSRNGSKCFKNAPEEDNILQNRGNC